MVKNIPRGHLVVHSPFYLVVNILGQINTTLTSTYEEEKANTDFLQFSPQQTQNSVFLQLELFSSHLKSRGHFLELRRPDIREASLNAPSYAPLLSRDPD